MSLAGNLTHLLRMQRSKLPVSSVPTATKSSLHPVPPSLTTLPSSVWQEELLRSEERRVGKEGRSREWPEQQDKKANETGAMHGRMSSSGQERTYDTGTR